MIENYIESNKAAWEEAFEKRKPNWGDDNHLRLKSAKFAFLDENLKKEFENLDLAGKTVAQFCCNNGRELLSIMDSGATTGIGFDIAENIIQQARETAAKAGIKNCTFVTCNILDITEFYHDQFDLVLFTIGAITWFKDLNLLFNKTAKCLKAGGLLLIHDFHPMINMLPLPGEDDFEDGLTAGNVKKIAHSYFRKEPWIENHGMRYMTTDYESKIFISFSHTLSDIINALSASGIKTVKFNEYDYDIGLTDVYDKTGFPLSCILIAEKCRLC